MSKEQKYMQLIARHRKDGTFTLAELAEWIEQEEGITYSAARSKSGRLVKRLPCEALSTTMFKLKLIPVAPKEPTKKQELVLQDQLEVARAIIAYLNEKTGSKYIGSAPDLAKIKARLSDGFTQMDFMIVIDKKVAEWKGTERAKYLRPETLFGGKFEGYLNSDNSVGGKVDEMAGYDFSKYIKT